MQADEKDRCQDTEDIYIADFGMRTFTLRSSDLIKISDCESKKEGL